VVDGHARVKVKTIGIRTPLWPGLRVTDRVWPSRVEIEHDGELPSRGTALLRPRSPDSQLEHYLDVLEKKPGADGRDQRRWNNGGKPDGGRSVWTRSGRKLETTPRAGRRKLER